MYFMLFQLGAINTGGVGKMCECHLVLERYNMQLEGGYCSPLVRNCLAFVSWCYCWCLSYL